jgi:hypothetical protein
MDPIFIIITLGRPQSTVLDFYRNTPMLASRLPVLQAKVSAITPAIP